jgi:hypothetical protein
VEVNRVCFVNTGADIWQRNRLLPQGGVNCTGRRQLFDDFAVDTDQAGWAHIAYSHDAPELGGSGTYTGYAVQPRARRSATPADTD